MPMPMKPKKKLTPKQRKRAVSRWRAEHRLSFPDIVKRVNEHHKREVLKLSTLFGANNRGMRFEDLRAELVREVFPDFPLV